MFELNVVKESSGQQIFKKCVRVSVCVSVCVCVCHAILAISKYRYYIVVYIAIPLFKRQKRREFNSKYVLAKILSTNVIYV